MESEIRMQAMLQELEQASNYFRTRCAQLAAECAVQIARADNAEKSIKQLQEEVDMLKPKEVNQ